MRTRKAMTVLAAVFCVVLVATAFLSVVLESSHAMHACMKEQCVVCATLTSVQSLLRNIARLIAGTATILLLVLAGFAAATRTPRQEKAATLITQKVRLNP